jgi:hypothetical protein
MNMNKPHKHWKEIAQYAQDAAETEKPWKRWQYRLNDANWTTFTKTDQFEDIVGIEYRRKPKTININGIEVPEPMREKPEIGHKYFALSFDYDDGYSEQTWEDHRLDLIWLSRGICHLTRKAAELHAKALLSFTKKEGTK